jgi:hypothetical protein
MCHRRFPCRNKPSKTLPRARMAGPVGAGNDPRSREPAQKMAKRNARAATERPAQLLPTFQEISSIHRKEPSTCRSSSGGWWPRMKNWFLLTFLLLGTVLHAQNFVAASFHASDLLPRPYVFVGPEGMGSGYAPFALIGRSRRSDRLGTLHPGDRILVRQWPQERRTGKTQSERP